MSSLNKVCLLGRLGQDPEAITTNAGGKIVKLSIATSEKWKDKGTGEKRERTEWHNVVIFHEGIGNIAEQYLNKGSQVYIEGKMQTRKWEDKEGKDRWTTEVVMNNFDAKLVLLGGGDGGGSQQGGGGAAPATAATATSTSNDLDDDIPF